MSPSPRTSPLTFDPGVVRCLATLPLLPGLTFNRTQACGVLELGAFPERIRVATLDVMLPSRRTVHGTLASILLMALGACSSASDEGAAGAAGNGPGGASGSGGGSGSPASPVPVQTGIDVVDRLGAAAAQCGYQSPSTVPASWDLASWGQGCSIWGPSGWAVNGAGTQLIFISDPANPYGTAVGGGVPSAGSGPTTCTARGAADYFLGLYTQLGCSSPTIAYYTEGELVMGTDTYPVGHSVFTCTYQGTPIVGYQFTMGMDGALCEVVLSSFWEPVDSIDAMTCNLSQILNSVSCPTGGSDTCVDVDCDAACRNVGKQGGQCPTSGAEGCECW